jgi:oxygen-independent coproporphyrinogen-3 oxidase
VCPYCDFAVTVGGEESRRRYLDALLAEVRLWSGGGDWKRPFDTVYFGGGTPSALAPAALEAIIAALAESFGTAGAWTHLEANPEDATAESAARWRALGVCFLSLGVQSFQAGALAFLGRRHDPRRARGSVEAALAAGFPVVSLDLIYGLPGQTEADWRRDLEAAVALAPQHLSCYQLTVEPGTPFGKRRERGELAELPEPRQAALFRFTHRFLADAGYAGYEVSNFARAPEHRSRHNRKYWDHSPYLGLGPSAHSFDGRRRRWWNHRRLAFWRAAVERGERPEAGREELSDEALALERLMLALRTAEGLALEPYRRRYGVDLAAANPELLADLRERGLATVAAGRLALTLDGLAVADALAARFDLAAAGSPA